MDTGDELNEYLRGDSALSCRYRSEAAREPPPALDRAVLAVARSGARSPAVKSPCLAPMAFAASALLSVALVAAIVLAPASNRRGGESSLGSGTATGAAHGSSAARVTPVRLYSEAEPRPPSEWLADIAALRRAGRLSEAAVEMQRFHSAYPHYIVPTDE
jgi:hypothetical protein